MKIRVTTVWRPVQPQGVKGVQRLLGGLVQRQVQQEAAVLFAAAVVGKHVGVPVLVQTVEAFVQRKVGAELRQAGRAVLAAAAGLPPGEQKHDHAQHGGEKKDGNSGVHGAPPKEFSLL